MPDSDLSRPDQPEPIEAVEVTTRWGLVGLSALATLGALLRMFGPGNFSLPERLDQTTLLYFGVAGALLLLRQVKTFSLGQLKFEMLEKLREQQQKQGERLADIGQTLKRQPDNRSSRRPDHAAPFDCAPTLRSELPIALRVRMLAVPNTDQQHHGLWLGLRRCALAVRVAQAVV